MRRLFVLALGVAIGGLLLAGPASAQTYAGGSPPQAGPNAPTHVLGEHFGAGNAANNSAFTPLGGGSNTPSFLASTGAEIAELVGIALVAIAVGTVLRRRREHPLA